VNLLKTRSVVLLSIILASSAVFGQVTAKNDPDRAKTTTGTSKAPPASVDSIQGDLREALSVIQDNYIGGKTLDNNEVFKSSMESMLNTLDPHSRYFDAKENEEFQTEQRSQ